MEQLCTNAWNKNTTSNDYWKTFKAVRIIFTYKKIIY